MAAIFQVNIFWVFQKKKAGKVIGNTKKDNDRQQWGGAGEGNTEKKKPTEVGFNVG